MSYHLKMFVKYCSGHTVIYDYRPIKTDNTNKREVILTKISQ